MPRVSAPTRVPTARPRLARNQPVPKSLDAGIGWEEVLVLDHLDVARVDSQKIECRQGDESDHDLAGAESPSAPEKQDAPGKSAEESDSHRPTSNARLVGRERPCPVHPLGLTEDPGPGAIQPGPGSQGDEGRTAQGGGPRQSGSFQIAERT